MYFELSLDVIMPPWTLGTVLYQKTFFQILIFKYAYNKSPGIRLQKFGSAWLTKSIWTKFSFLPFHGLFSCQLWCFQGLPTSIYYVQTLPDIQNFKIEFILEQIMTINLDYQFYFNLIEKCPGSRANNFRCL